MNSKEQLCRDLMAWVEMNASVLEHMNERDYSADELRASTIVTSKRLILAVIPRMPR